MQKPTPASGFKDFNLSELTLKAITEMGFENPTPIQTQTLPILLGEPTDFLGLAATGTGKTGAFGIPLLERIDSSQRGVQALILCPTRELAMQVAEQLRLMGKHKGVKVLAIYGGAGYGDQMRGLRSGVQVVVGTPGRVVDHIDRGTLELDGLRTLILDEADEMISMGFKDDLEKVLESVPEGQSNTWLFSATMSPEIRRVADQHLNNPKQVQVNRTEVLSSGVEQIYYATQESNKSEVLCKIIDAADEFYGIIFCQTKALVMDLNQYLRGRGYQTDCLHGDMDQNARDRTMRSFRDRKVSILIATDVACRGLDVKDMTHVVNYSIPRELDNYIHRIGRTARSGKAGLALSLVTPSHRRLIGRIEQMTKSRMKEGKIPTRKEIGTRRVAKSLSLFENQSTHQKVTELLDESWKKSIANMTKEEITGRFLSLLHPEIFAERDLAQMVRTSGVVPVAGVVRGEGGFIESARSESNSRFGGERFRGRSDDRRGSDRYENRGERRSSFGDRPVVTAKPAVIIPRAERAEGDVEQTERKLPQRRQFAPSPGGAPKFAEKRAAGGWGQRAGGAKKPQWNRSGGTEKKGYPRKNPAGANR